MPDGPPPAPLPGTPARRISSQDSAVFATDYETDTPVSTPPVIAEENVYSIVPGPQLTRPLLLLNEQG